MNEDKIIMTNTEEFSFKNPENFASAARQSIRDVTKTADTRRKTTFSSYSKDEIIKFLNAPETSSTQLRNASIQMFQNSTQYRRLVQYHALLPLWSYIISPVAYNPQKTNASSYLKQYAKVTQFIEMMNIRHEMQKATLITYREGILYGAIWKTNNSWFIQRVDPDLCTLIAIEDGTWLYGVDMSRIKEEELFRYPPEFTTMWNAYGSSGQKLQEVPSDISFCLKADETNLYPIPPFASILPSVCDLETFKELAQVSTELDNYKLLTMEVPTKDGEPTMSWDLIMQFYKHLSNSLPDNVGAAALPMKLDTINFEKSGLAQKTDEQEQATRNYWYSTGSSPLLFGDSANSSSSALALSIHTDEEFVFATMEQCQRLINRHLRSFSGSVKFKITILPVTIFNQDKMIGYYKEAATYGLPVKQAYAATVGIQSSDLLGTAFLENEIMDLGNVFVPLSSSHTQSGEATAGAPAKADEDLTEAGEQTRENGSDANKE